MWSDDPIRDAYRHDAEQEAKIEKLPKCDYCNETIQDDFCYEINGDIICEDCLVNNFRKSVEDYI